MSKLGVAMLGAVLGMAAMFVLFVIRDPLGIRRQGDNEYVSPTIYQAPNPSLPGLDQPRPLTPSVEIAIYVLADGTFESEGETFVFDQLDVVLRRIRDRNGTLIYSRQSPSEEPTDAQKAALQRVRASGVPYRQVDRLE
jgi:hypothetical protein